MSIVDLKTCSLESWERIILDRYPFSPYWWIRGLPPESGRSLMAQELDRACTNNKTVLLGYVPDFQDVHGFVQARWLGWDTDHFGFQIWRLDHLCAWGDSAQKGAVLEALVQACISAVCQQGGQSIQARMPLDNLLAIHALEGAGFQTMEVLTTWIFDLRWPIPSKKHPEWVRDALHSDRDPMIDLARTVYTPIPDRFHVDSHLSSKASDDLYAEWIRNSFSGALADHIAVAEVDGQAVGYSTMKYVKDFYELCGVFFGQLGLGGVSPQYRNQGIVTDLVIHNLEKLNRRQARYCFVGTQGNNLPPQRVWLKVGFKPASMALTMHYWADERT